MALKTNYINDILDTTKNTERKYNIKSASGTIVNEGVTFEDVTEYTSEGDRFGASDINATNTKVNELDTNLINSNGEAFRFGYQDGKRGYLINEEGADTFYPFKSTDISFPVWQNYGPKVISRFYPPSDVTYRRFRYSDFTYDSNQCYINVVLNDDTNVTVATSYTGSKNKDYTAPEGKWITQVYIQHGYSNYTLSTVTDFLLTEN